MNTEMKLTTDRRFPKKFQITSLLINNTFTPVNWVYGYLDYFKGTRDVPQIQIIFHEFKPVNARKIQGTLPGNFLSLNILFFA